MTSAITRYQRGQERPIGLVDSATRDLVVEHAPEDSAER